MSLFKLVLQHATSAILIVVAGRQLVQLARHPHDRALRALTIGVVCLAVAATVNISGSPLYPMARSLLGDKVYSALVNALFGAIPFVYAAFFVLARRAATTTTPRVVWALVLIWTVDSVAWLVLPFIAPATFAPAPGHSMYRDMAWLVPALMSYCMAMAVWVFGLFQGHRYLRELSNDWLRWAVRLVLLGAVGMAAVHVASVAKILMRAAEGATTPKRYPVTSAVYITGLLGGQALLALGLVLPTVGALATAVARAYKRYARTRCARSMYPLWQRLTNAFPFIVLHDAVTLSTFDRRVCEISDGLAQLSPYYRAAGLTDQEATDGVYDPHRAALLLTASLDAHRRGGQRAEPPYPRFEPDFTSWRRRSTWMIRVADRLDQLASRSPGEVSPVS